MDILIISDFMGKMDESGNGRFDYLAKMLIDKNDVEILTSDFNHNTKSYFENIPNGLPYKVTMVHEGPYHKNVCLKRNYAHVIWSGSVKKYLHARKRPDVIYCAVPPLSAAFVAAKYCEKNHIRFIIDIQDLWPEAFKMVFHIPLFSKLIFTPFDWMADGIYKRADEVIGVSQTYVNRALKVNHKCNKGHSIFLGTDLDTFDKNVQENIVKREDSDEIWLGYCGTLGSSYDLPVVFDAVRKIKNKNLKVIVMGDGPKRKEFEKKAKRLNVQFTGLLPYPRMCGMLSACDIVVNPIMKGAAQSIINKHMDYAMSGLPVINTQECEEYRNLVKRYECGINCRCGNSDDVADAILKLIEDSDKRKQLGDNHRTMAEKLFDRKQSYQELVYCIKTSKK